MDKTFQVLSIENEVFIWLLSVPGFRLMGFWGCGDNSVYI